MILMLLIFFTSIGSAVAVEDNDLSDSPVDVSSDLTYMEISTSDDDSIISDEASINSSDDADDDVTDGVIIDDSTKEDFNIDDSDDSIADVSDVSEKKEPKNILGSTEDPIIIKNGVISISSSLLTSPQTIVIKDAKYYNGSINTYVQKLIDDAADLVQQ